ncbi:MAG: aminopeptidase P family protein [Ruminococcus sp.]|nr:aminopeptidase P family protein [Ruminococcus sp.]
MTTLAKIAEKLTAADLDALLITDASPEAMRYVTTMRGLEGTVLIFSDGHAMVLTDSRYVEDADAKLTPLGFTVTVPKGGRPTAEALNALLCHEGVRRLGYLDADLPVRTYRHLRDQLTNSQLTAAGNILTGLRRIKTQEEADAIVKAQRIAEAAFDAVLGVICPGMTEKELAALLEYEMAKRGSECPSFDTIFISGAKTSMPHGIPDEKQIVSGEPILVDFGAVCDGYHSDMTRTFSIGDPGAEFRRVYEIVRAAQEAALSAAAAGTTCSEIHNAAFSVIDHAGYGAYFGHAVGHGVGLEIHEEPGVGPRSKGELEIGSVITIEPGIYLPGKFGVRIEDMLYISPDGTRNLTNTPKGLLIL